MAATTDVPTKSLASPKGQRAINHPFTHLFFKKAHSSRRVPKGEITKWVGKNKVNALLKDFKHDEIDPNKKNKLLADRLGPDHEGWADDAMKSLSEYASKQVPDVHLRAPSTKPTQQRARLATIVQKIVKTSNVPGADEYNMSSSEHLYRCRMATALILTVIKDLQHSKLNGHFGKLLGGNEVRSWSGVTNLDVDDRTEMTGKAGVLDADADKVGESVRRGKPAGRAFGSIKRKRQGNHQAEELHGTYADDATVDGGALGPPPSYPGARSSTITEGPIQQQTAGADNVSRPDLDVHAPRPIPKKSKVDTSGEHAGENLKQATSSEEPGGAYTPLAKTEDAEIKLRRLQTDVKEMFATKAKVRSKKEAILDIRGKSDGQAGSSMEELDAALVIAVDQLAELETKLAETERVLEAAVVGT